MAVNINVPSQVKTYANLATFPATGALKTIYIAEDTNKTYRWTGSVYTEISASAAMTWGAIGGTLSNQTDLQNALDAKQNTLVSGTNIKTLEGQSLLGSGNIDLTKSDVGLSNVDNTSDLNKPISTATQTALDAKENTITAGTTSQYFRGDKTFQTLDKAAVGLGNVDNTSDANKPISTATQTALNAKQNTLSLTTTGSSGASTLVGATINVPNYTLSGLGGVPTSRTLTINGVTQDLSADRTFTISTGITIGSTAIASGTVGRILFEGAGNVVQESANLFWNNTNSRLGIGTASPSYTLQVAGTIKATGGTQAGAIFGAGVELTLGSDAYIQCTSTTGKNAGLTIHRFSTAEYASIDLVNGGSFATGWSIQSRPSSTRLDIVDRNPSDNMRMSFHNGGNITIGTTTDAGFKLDVNGTARVQGKLSVNTPTATSAVMEVTSTTQGFLPPRMTTTQKNAIATPAAGLVVYDTTLNKLCVYTTAWETVTSL